MSKIHIRLTGRRGDAEIWELSYGDVLNSYRAFISGCCIAAGGRWQEIAAQSAKCRASLGHA